MRLKFSFSLDLEDSELGVTAHAAGVTPPPGSSAAVQAARSQSGIRGVL